MSGSSAFGHILVVILLVGLPVASSTAIHPACAPELLVATEGLAPIERAVFWRVVSTHEIATTPVSMTYIGAQVRKRGLWDKSLASIGAATSPDVGMEWLAAIAKDIDASLATTPDSGPRVEQYAKLYDRYKWPVRYELYEALQRDLSSAVASPTLKRTLEHYLAALFPTLAFAYTQNLALADRCFGTDCMEIARQAARYGSRGLFLLGGFIAFAGAPITGSILAAALPAIASIPFTALWYRTSRLKKIVRARGLPTLPPAVHRHLVLAPLRERINALGEIAPLDRLKRTRIPASYGRELEDLTRELLVAFQRLVDELNRCTEHPIDDSSVNQEELIAHVGDVQDISEILRLLREQVTAFRSTLDEQLTPSEGDTSTERAWEFSITPTEARERRGKLAVLDGVLTNAALRVQLVNDHGVSVARAIDRATFEAFQETLLRLRKDDAGLGGMP